MRPGYWRPYSEQIGTVLAKAQSIAELKRKQPGEATAIDQAVARTGIPADQLGWLPVQSRKSSGWVAFVTRDKANVVGFAPVEGF